MANNRLYIADLETETYTMISKGFGGGWDGLRNPERLDKFLRECGGMGDIDCKNSLILFTEYDDLYEKVFDKESEWEEIKL